MSVLTETIPLTQTEQAVLSYYLRHREEVDAYVSRQQEGADTEPGKTGVFFTGFSDQRESARPINSGIGGEVRLLVFLSAC